MLKDRMEKIYRDTPPDKIPWNVATPPEILQTAIRAHAVGQARVLDLGCGTGNYVIHFSKLGLDMTGVDISDNAIRIARRSASSAGVTCRFVVADVLGTLPGINDRFDVVYDWELLHHIFPEDRETYLRNVHRLMNPDGRYLSVCFSEESPQFGGIGKYRTTPLDTILYFSSEKELESLFAKCFVVEELRTIDVSGRHAVHKAIYALMRKTRS